MPRASSRAQADGECSSKLMCRIYERRSKKGHSDPADRSGRLNKNGSSPFDIPETPNCHAAESEQASISNSTGEED